MRSNLRKLKSGVKKIEKEGEKARRGGINGLVNDVTSWDSPPWGPPKGHHIIAPPRKKRN